MRTYIYLVALVLQGAAAYAQVSEKTVIPAGDSISNHYRYLFPSFKEAKVKFRDGRSFTYKMDFNMLLCVMQYINTKGDTLEITNAELIDSIRMDSCAFTYDNQKGYFQIIAVSDAASLAVNRRCTFQFVQKGAMDKSEQSSQVQMITDVNGRQGSIPLVSDQDTYVVRTTTYLLVLKSGEMMNAGKTPFMKIYNGDKKTVEQYIKANKINFNQQDDLEKLFDFCTQTKM
jgi:hypothetical protein